MMLQEPTQAPILLARLRELLIDKDFESSELFSGLAALGWGAVVALPTLDTFGRSPAFLAMRALPEDAWGWGVMLLGLAQLSALLWGGHRARYLWSWAVLLLWFFLASAFVLAGAFDYAVLCLTFAASDAWAVWRLKVLRRDRGG